MLKVSHYRLKVGLVSILLLIFNIHSIQLAKSEPRVIMHKDALHNYVNDLVKDGVEILQDQSLTLDEKTSKTKQLILSNLDLKWMASYTLGRNMRTLSSTQVEKFSDLYSSYVIKSYSDLIKSYKGEKTNIKAIQNLDEAEHIVQTEIVDQYGQPKLRVDYLIRDTGNTSNSQFKVSDVITEGVSMINSQRNEFNSIILNDGFDKLISILQQKLQPAN